MRRNLYIAAFVAVLLVACVGGFLGGRVLLTRLQGDFTPRSDETPVPEPPATIEVTPIAQAESPSSSPEAGEVPTEAPRATATMLVVPAPVTDQPAVLTPEPTWTAGVELPTSEFGGLPGPGLGPLPGATPGEDLFGTAAPSATPILDSPFVLARAVRYSSNDCPGTYALGQVTDRSGNPLPGIRLRLVDEYGNAAIAVTKPGPGDTGRYDFPMGGPPRRFFMTVVDDAGRGLSPEVTILHDLAPQQGKTCRWVDWRRS